MPLPDPTAPASFASPAQETPAQDIPTATLPIARQSGESAPNPALKVEVSALSDVGNVRTNNEDYFGYDEATNLYAVCDGMGGMASGEVASAGAVATLLATFAASKTCGGALEARLFEAIRAANTVIWEQGQATEHKGMGTTLVALALEGNRLLIGNVGDSRAYVFQDSLCTQLTVDHSYVNELIRSGALTVETAHNANLAGMESVITRAIGAKATVEPDLSSVELRTGTLVLLATDGLTRYLEAQELAAVLAGTPFETTCAELIRIAKRRGGKDNITCLLLRFT